MITGEHGPDHLPEKQANLSALPPPRVVLLFRLINGVSMDDNSMIIPDQPARTLAPECVIS